MPTAWLYWSIWGWIEATAGKFGFYAEGSGPAVARVMDAIDPFPFLNQVCTGWSGAPSGPVPQA